MGQWTLLGGGRLSGLVELGQSIVCFSVARRRIKEMYKERIVL